MLIFALDVKTVKDAKFWIDLLYPRVSYFKVGLELFLSTGWDVVDYIKEKNCKVFLDLKLHDITETVKQSLTVIATHNVDMTTIMIGDNPQAISHYHNIQNKPKLIGVTVLTSVSQQNIYTIYDNILIPNLVLDRAYIGYLNGLNGVVCSPEETKKLRGISPELIIINPGIRMPEFKCKNDDQQRVGTPYQAIKDGAHYLVIGRPIRNAENPIAMIEDIQENIELAFS